MKHRKWLLIAALALSVVLSIGGTMAYLTDTDEDVNVMTLGNVDIEQLEYERVVDENGDWVSTGEVDKYGYTPDEIQKFTQGKPLYPAVNQDGNIKWDDRVDGHQQSWGQVVSEAGNPTSGSNQLFDDSVKNTIDKFVFVENTGRGDAYVRTWFAFELGDVPAAEFHDVIQMNTNQNQWAWEWPSVKAVEIDGNNYMVAVATYLGPVSNPTGILAPGAITYPSLLQVYMKPEATNEDVEAIDGNDNGTYDILVLSQAAQTMGFEDAESALTAGFGEAALENIPWTEVNIPTLISTVAELQEALATGGSYMLSNDITGSGETFEVAQGVEVDIDLAGYTITNAVSGGPALTNNGTLTLSGGSVVNGTNDTRSSHTIVNNGVLTIESGSYGTDDTAGAAISNYGTVTINGGTFASKQENTKGDGLCAYAFINNSGTMTINNATLDGQTHGLFGAYDGTITVNGGNYTMDGNGGLGCYVVYATGNGKVELLGGTINANEPRNNRVFFVYANSKNYFNAAAVETGSVVVNGATIYLDGVQQGY